MNEDSLKQLFNEGDNKLLGVNSSFQHRIGHCYTWCSPGGIKKTQIDS